MTLGDKLKLIRRESGLSQEAIGAQGFISAPGWIKLENGQRSPSERLIEELVAWLVQDKHIRSNAGKGLKEELLTLKYLGSQSVFLRNLALTHVRTLPTGDVLLAPSPLGAPKRGRPKLATTR